jgi:hypothetical protein
VHEHGGSVALLVTALAMHARRYGRQGIAVFGRQFRLTQADTQIFNQLKKVFSALRIADPETVKVAALFRSFQPLFDDAGTLPLQNLAHKLKRVPKSAT